MHIEFDIPDTVLHRLLDAVEIPPMAPVKYTMETPQPLSDITPVVSNEVRAYLASSPIKAGHRIAIGVGSRGIGHLPDIVSTLVSELRRHGADPFIIPTMGSHGGATAEGQSAVLAYLGITADRVGAPVESQMAVTEIGRTQDGLPIYMDRLALAADGIVFVARVKPHTAFRGAYESGLAKMIAIGLGKQAGAATCHAQGFGHIARLVPQMAELIIARTPILFGLAVLENAHEQPFKIAAIPAAKILSDEPALLDEAKQAMPHIPFASLDVLIIDQIGKNISGDGADPNITGRYPTPYASGGPEVTKQVILDLTEETDGNANGIGTADFTTARAIRKMSLANMYPNALTSTVVRPVALPMILSSDHLALAAAILTCNAVGRAPRMMRIVDTLHLSEFFVTPGLLDEVARNEALHLVEDPTPLPFDTNGNLILSREEEISQQDYTAYIPSLPG